MICNICSETVHGIWDPSSPRRLSRDIPPQGQDKKLAPDHPENYIFGHHRTSESLTQSINDGCPICKRLQTPVDHSKRSKYGRLGYFSILGVRLGTPCALYGKTDQEGFFIEIMCPVESPTLTLSGSTGDADALQLIQGWLDTCVQTHKACNRVGKFPFVPPRLLQMDVDSKSFHIVPAAEVAPGTRYATLTDCYGPDDEGTRLLRSSTERFRSQKQPLSTLPQSYRDACEVAAQLGLSHMWIERLCVIQDSRDDQLSHQHKDLRRDILSNSFCGIGAAGSISSSYSLFTRSDRGFLAPDVFYFQTEADAPPAPHVLLGEISTGKLRAFMYAPISKSARALRDRLLVPRMVYFGTQMLFWECHAAHCDELGTMPTAHYGDHVFGREGELACGGRPVAKLWKPLFEYNVRHHDDPVNQILNRWAEFVMGYSRLSLVPSEKLPLLENLALEAELLLSAHGCEDTKYLAGMWRMAFPSALLWQSRRTSETRPPAYHAPSWSWASADGEVIIVPPADVWGKGLLCEFVDDTCTSDDCTGAVLSASITLRGKLLRGKLAPFPDEAYLAGRMWISSLVGAEEEDDSTSRLSIGPVQVPIYSDCTARFDWEEDKAEEALFLPVQVRTEDYGPSKAHMLHGILLSRLDDGRYVRCGDWRVQTKTLDEALHVVDSLPFTQLEII